MQSYTVYTHRINARQPGLSRDGQCGDKPHAQVGRCAGRIPVHAFCKRCSNLGISKSSWLLVDAPAEHGGSSPRFQEPRVV